MVVMLSVAGLCGKRSDGGDVVGGGSLWEEKRWW
jgi:hypothetical protein